MCVFHRAAQVSDILIDLYDSIYKDGNIAPFEKLEKDWLAKQAKIAKTERPPRRERSSSTSAGLLLLTRACVV